MADDTTKLVLQVSADIKSLERSLRAAQNDNKRVSDAITKDWQTSGKQIDAVSDGIRRSMAQTQQATKNLGFQFTDITQGLLSGQSPFIIAAQQSGQAASAIQDLAKSGGLLRGIGGALGATFSPAALGVTAGILGIGLLISKVQEYFGGVEEGTEEADKALKAHVDLISNVAKEWGEAVPALQEFARAAKEAADIKDLKAATNLHIDKIFEQARETVKGLTVDVADLVNQLEAAGESPENITKIQTAFKALQKAIAEGRDSTKETRELTDALIESWMNTGVSAAQSFAASIHGIAAAFGEYAKQAEEARRQAQAAIEARRVAAMQENLPGNLGQLSPLYSGGGQFQNEQQAMDQRARFTTPESMLSGLDSEFRSRITKFIEAAEAQVGKIVVNSGFRTVERQRQLFDEAVKKYGSADAARKWVAPPGNSQHNQGRAADLGFETEAVKRWAHENAAAYGLVFRLKNEDWHVELQRAEATNATANAQRNQTTTTSGLASGTVQLTEAQKRQLEAQNQQQASIEQTAQAYSNIAQGALRGFISDLQNGVKAGEAFRNSLGRIVDGLIDLTIKQMFATEGFQNFFRQLAGGFGMFGQAGIAFGGGVGLYHRGTGGGTRDMRNVSPGLFAGAPRLHSGLQPGEFPAILQTGEKVVPRSVVRRGGGAGNTTSISNDISIDISTGMVTANSQDARDLGEQINKAVQAVIVAESRPGGLLKQGR